MNTNDLVIGEWLDWQENPDKKSVIKKWRWRRGVEDGADGILLGDFTIIFPSGTPYTYTDVPYSIYLAFGEAESKGSFFHKQIRDNFKTYQGRKEQD